LTCEKCNNDHDGTYGSGRFCSSHCARSSSTKDKREEINKKVSDKLKGKPTGRTLSDEDITRLQTAKGIRPPRKEYILSLDFNSLKYEMLRERLLYEQDYKCHDCYIDEWKGHFISLELEHIDGNRDNNDRSNLKMICPNCHSITPTWRGRNKQSNKNRYTDKEMYTAYLKNDNIFQTLKSLDMAAKGANYARLQILIERFER